MKAKFRQIFDLLRAEVACSRPAAGARFATIREICGRFGVSYVTAHRALAELRAAGVIRTARGKASRVCGEARALALIVPSREESECYAPMCREIAACVARQGLQLVYSEMAGESARECARLIHVACEDALRRGVAAVLYLPLFYGRDFRAVNRAVFARFRAARTPLVLFDNDVGVEADGFDFVGIDNMGAGERLARHLLACGARRLLFVAAREVAEASNAVLRFAGVARAVKDACGRSAGLFELTARTAAQLRAQLRRGAYDGLIGLNDATAVKLMDLARAAGRRVPRDVRIAGFNGLDIARLACPGLTTVRQPFRAIAETLVDTALWRIAHPDAAARRIFLASDLVVRASTAEPGTANEGGTP